MAAKKLCFPGIENVQMLGGMPGGYIEGSN